MSFWRSDLTVEFAAEGGMRGVEVTKGEVDGFSVLRVQIGTEEAAVAWGKPRGHYVTVESAPLGALEAEETERLCRVLGDALRTMAEQLCHKPITEAFSVLVVGLGNRASTPDAVGSETVQRLSVTRHLSDASFPRAGLCRISAIEPGVPAVTGLETAETVRGIVIQTSPDLVIAVDALTARSAERLGATVQLSDGGIRPASGIGRGHCALDRESLGVPVISLGVPTAVGSDTLAYDLLRRAGVTDLREVKAALELGKKHLVTLGEIDLLVRSAGTVLSVAIERAFSLS